MFIDQQRILEDTGGGLKIILYYYPQAAASLQDNRRKFKIREGEKTASATLKQLGDGNWVVTDFGGDQKPKNGILITMEEECCEFKEALQILAERYGIEQDKPSEILKPEITTRDARPEENEKEWYFNVRDGFTDMEVKTVLADKVVPYLKDGGVDMEKVQKVFQRYHFYALESYSIVKDRKVITIAATDRYPIFMWDEGNFKKIYQPLSPDKSHRFMYYGTRPKDFLHGIDVCVKAKSKLNEDIEEEDDEGKKPKEKKLDEIIYCSGGSDAMNLAMIAYQVVWPNSETAKLTSKHFKSLSKLAHKVMNMPDIDLTGIREAHRLAMEYLDMYTIVLPEELRQRPDKRGNPSKDVRDYLKHWAPYDFKMLVNTALPYRFWDEIYKSKSDGGSWSVDYHVKNTRLYNFLCKNGFFRIQNRNKKEGYIFVQVQDNIVKEIEANEVKNFVQTFLKERYFNEDLRDVFFKTNQLKEGSMSNLPMVEIDFSDYTKDSQYFFFENRTVEVTKSLIKAHKLGEVQRYVWEDEVIKHRFKEQDPHFAVSRTPDGQWDIEVRKKDNVFLNFLINTCRIHWRKELEERTEDLKEAAQHKYQQEHKFDIAGPNLENDEILEQKHHLVNKIYILGYLLHRYKDPSRPWAIWAMDHRLSDDGESHGGSGKSITMGSISRFMKSVTLKGRDPKLTDNTHMYDRVTIHTDYILVDDANQYLKFDVFFSDITGNMVVNPKNNQSYEIPYEESPKFAFSSNFPLRNIDSSVLRRILYTVFSDYYHENKDGYYRESRNPREELGKNILGPDYTETDWNDFYNFMLQCCSFYMQHSKIDPPLENVEKRNMLSEMGPAFHEWADTYFAEESGRLNSFQIKTAAFDDFMKSSNAKWSSQKFTKALKAFCKYYGYVLDPSDYCNSQGRIIKKITDEKSITKTVEMIYIDTTGTDITPPPRIETSEDNQSLANDLEKGGDQEELNF